MMPVLVQAYLRKADAQDPFKIELAWIRSKPFISRVLSLIVERQTVCISRNGIYQCPHASLGDDPWLLTGWIYSNNGGCYVNGIRPDQLVVRNDLQRHINPVGMSIYVFKALCPCTSSQLISNTLCETTHRIHSTEGSTFDLCSHLQIQNQYPELNASPRIFLNKTSVF